MAHYEDEMDHYREDAEERFDNYYPEDSYEDDEGYEEYYVEEEEPDYEYAEYIDFPGGGGLTEYDNYGLTSIQQIDPNDRTFTFIVTNSDTADKDVVLFGANENLAPPSGVTVQVAESSHSEVREESKANPFIIQGMKMSVTDTQQFDQVLKLVSRSAAGTHVEQTIQPRNYYSPQNYSDKLIDASDFYFRCTGKDSIRFVAKPGTTVFTFTIKARANMGNVLAGRNVAEMSTAPRTTGLPQIDLMRTKKTPVPFGLKKSRKVRKVARPASNSRQGRKTRKLGSRVRSFLKRR